MWVNIFCKIHLSKTVLLIISSKIQHLIQNKKWTLDYQIKDYVKIGLVYMVKNYTYRGSVVYDL